MVSVQSIHSDYFKCKLLNSNLTVNLLGLSFYNVTKRNKPKVKVNELILARIVRIDGEFVLVSCKEEWLGQVDKLIDKYEINNENMNKDSLDSVVLEQSRENMKNTGKDSQKHIIFVSPITTTSIFINGLSIDDTFAIVGMNGVIVLWGKRNIEVERKIYELFQ